MCCNWQLWLEDWEFQIPSPLPGLPPSASTTHPPGFFFRNGRREACSKILNQLRQQWQMPHRVSVSTNTWKSRPLDCYTDEGMLLVCCCQLQLHCPGVNLSVETSLSVSTCWSGGLLLYLDKSGPVYHGHKPSAAHRSNDPRQVFQSEQAAVETRNQETWAEFVEWEVGGSTSILARLSLNVQHAVKLSSGLQNAAGGLIE